jgi:integrase
MKKKSKKIRTSKPPNRSIGDSLSPEQICAIFTAASSDPSLRTLSNVVRVVLHSGLQGGILPTLRISDVDIKNNRLRVDSPKSDDGQRFIPLAPVALEALMHLHDLNPESEFILGDKANTRISIVRRSLHRLGEQIGIENLNLHSLRSTFVSTMLSSGTNT